MCIAKLELVVLELLEVLPPQHRLNHARKHLFRLEVAVVEVLEVLSPQHRLNNVR